MAPKVDPQYQAKMLLEDMGTFRRNTDPVPYHSIPEIRQRRKMTDVAFIGVLAVCLLVLFGLLIYSAGVKGDIRRFTNGYDSCGNICGIKNEPVDGVSCSGLDLTDRPRCSNSIWAVNEFKDKPGILIATSLVGLGLSLVALILFRYFPGPFVWTMMALFILFLFAISGFFWYLYSTDEYMSVVAPIVFTLVSIIFVILTLVLIPRIKLIIKLLEETIKIVFSMKLILIEPVLTILSHAIALGFFIFTLFLLITAGDLKLVDNEYDDSYTRYDYIPDGPIYFTIALSCLVYIWMVYFFLACQQIVISGAVAAVFFARDKLTLISPIYDSFYNLCRFHVGSAAFGSLLITLIELLKILVRSAARNNGWMKIVYICCLRPLENLMRYLTSMGYIIVAIHGQPLCRSGVRAVNLIICNSLTAIAVNSVGNYVFFMAKLLVVVISVLVGYFVSGVDADFAYSSLLIGGVISFLCAHCFFVVFEIGLDTIFICYCEDKEVNNGMDYPYCTSLNMQTYLKTAQMFEVKKKKK